MRVAIHTLGCKVNRYESEAISEVFARRGAEIVPEDAEADVYIVNTCTVTNLADRKSRQFIRRMKALNPDALMVVTGCYAQVSSDALTAMPEVDLIIGNSLKSEIPDRVEELLAQRSAFLEGSRDIHVLPYEELTQYEDMGIVTSSESAMSRAYLKIEEGCNRFCSYCLIPYARGKIRSRRPEEVLQEAEQLLGQGFRELVLTGINTALYGREPGFDFLREPGEEGMEPLEALIRRLDRMPGDFRVRLSSLEPTVVDRDNVERIVRYGKLCRHLHLSIQSGSDTVLERMNRHYTQEEYLSIVQALREYDPLYGITTDIIVGFPGETEEEFRETLETVKQVGFGRVHIFRYSPRKGTAAVKLPGAVPGPVSAERASRLEKAAGESAAEFYRKNLGTVQEVLAEERDGDLAAGYTGNYIRVWIRDPEERVGIGEIVRVRLTELSGEGCLAELEE
ncbi:MAG: tRNA (N(6)-L-threonylcarbamoyladenosine(37)-C(2))-methylthiotransferase MtaB [Mogibacterium sp.]|nr:tRNA (N(6)-L-threonylcarbamoyladenosine(37)-C(2))-methylthiotransferase MtaB [Mogibacterium sp.]